MVVEALRRTVGWALTIVVLVFLVYAPLGQYVPGSLQGLPVNVQQLAFYLVWDPGSMLGLPVLVAATIVIAFVFFGNLLFASGGSNFFTDIALTLMGRYRGGSAKIAVTASCLFGMISGSAVSNVASVGVLTIPLMRRGGYPGHVAAAIEAVASTGGQLMPPVMGAAAFLMAEFLQIPYRDVAVAAALPSLLYYYALFIQADLLAARAGLQAIDMTGVPPLAPGAQAGLALRPALRGAGLQPVLAELVAGTGGARRFRRADRHRHDARLWRQEAEIRRPVPRAAIDRPRLARPADDHRGGRLHHRRAQHHGA